MTISILWGSSHAWYVCLFMFVCSRKVDLQPMHATLKNVTVLSNKQAWQSAFHEQNIWLISAKVQSNRI